ncbi:TonB-dependent receptor [Ferrimonas sediminicola]|uniref:TonB-dependent receptor n=1 Tax=Ferrimonas sediminicola TaxID=2569538 RepID=A0A4U1BBC4_9GAMM|nr:TonB-dependent receptor [Ferrimonas sediminicola]TKB48237.1 TonB-dependent receptor [Ferrimonas sediminicola]
MTTHTTVAKSVRHVMLLAAGATAFGGFSAYAAEENGDVERIEVTGSRIKRADMETASPVTVISADTIKASGATTIDSVLQKMTATGGAMTNPGINNGSGGNARIDLRGLGAQRTLVLLNGRRMIASGTGAASTVDLNTIPVSMVERIEVLKDGASAVYGSDAVSGVVNIILKQNFEGAELNVQTGVSGEGDANETSIDLTLGASFDRGNVVLGVQYMDRGDASQADRDFSDCPIAEREGADGSLELYCGGSSYAPGGTIWTEDAKYKGDPDNTWRAFNDGDFYNYSQASYLFTPMERLNLTGIGRYELSDSMSLFTEATYSKRWSQQQMAPQPVWFDFQYADWMGTDAGTANPFIVGEDISYGRRLTDVGTRNFSQNVDTVRLVVGVQGELENGWSWDVSYNFGRNDSVDRLANLVNMGSIQDDIETQNFNPLNQASWSDLTKYVYTEQNSGGSEMSVFSASVSGDLFELPAGYVAMAAGYEHRSEEAWYIPDSLTAQGLANDPPVEPTGGDFDVDELYAEFVVPLVSDAFLADSIELTAAARYFDYSTFGDDSTWKLGLTWRMNDQLMLRGVASTAFRAPTVDELYGGKSPSFEQVVYPGAQDQAEVTVGGNDMLTPEEADTVTAGLVYEPSWFEGFSLTFDYYNIQIDNAIASVNEQYIVDLCLAADGSGTPINTSNPVCQSSGIFMDNSKRIIFENGLQNIGAEETSGYDLNLAYQFEAFGLDWNTSLDTTYLEEYKVTVAGETTDYAGLITGGIGGYAEWKSNLDVTVASDNWDISYQARYIDGMDSSACLSDPSECYAPSVGSVVYHDLSGSYIFTDKVSLRAGVNNLFDKQPPYYSGNNDSNTDPYTYDVLGRYFFANLNVKF